MRHTVPVTRSCEETVGARVLDDRTLREALLREAVESVLAGDANTGNRVLVNSIKATGESHAIRVTL
jgi:hypothetical protein